MGLFLSRLFFSRPFFRLPFDRAPDVITRDYEDGVDEDVVAVRCMVASMRSVREAIRRRHDPVNSPGDFRLRPFDLHTTRISLRTYRAMFGKDPPPPVLGGARPDMLFIKRD